MKTGINILMLIALLGLKLSAQPDFSQRALLHGVVICPDMKQKQVYYFLPEDLELMKNKDGQPAFRFIMMRYTGNGTFGDMNSKRFRNIMQMDVALKAISQDTLTALKKSLRKINPGFTLRPVPVSRLEAIVHYVAVNDTLATRLGKGNWETGGESSLSTSSSYWRERTFTIYPDNQTADLFNQSLKSGRLILSLSYAFFSKGKADADPVSSVSGPRKYRKMLSEIIPKPDTSANVIKECLVKANAFEIETDTLMYKTLVSQIDLNDAVPPGYALLNVYDFDFNNEIRNDLYEKIVEIAAEGAGGGTVTTQVIFKKRQPDLYASAAKFKYAVRLDKPFRYRIIEISEAGEEKKSDWVAETAWHRELNTTTKTITNE